MHGGIIFGKEHLDELADIVFGELAMLVLMCMKWILAVMLVW